MGGGDRDDDLVGTRGGDGRQPRWLSSAERAQR